MAFVTNQRWAHRSWQARGLDVRDGVPWADLDLWGVRIAKRLTHAGGATGHDVTVSAEMCAPPSAKPANSPGTSSNSARSAA